MWISFSVLVGSGTKPMMFENQMKKNSVATKGNHLVAICVSMLPPVMLLRVRS